MITIPINYQATTGVPPYSYTWSVSDTCLDLEYDTGVSTDGFISNIATTLSESCINTTSVTLNVVDASGCERTDTITLTNICNNFTLGPVTEVNDYTFSVTASSPFCSDMTYSWEYDTTLFSLVTVIGNSAGSTVQLTPIDGVVFPATTNITVVATDCNGCVKTSNLTFSVCRPNATDFTYNLYCNDAETQYVGNTFYMPAPTGCNYDYDWTTVEYGPVAPGITLTPSERFFQANADITMAPGTYTVDYIVSSTDGIRTLAGTITIIINSCSPGNTISIPTLTYTIDCSVMVGDVVEIPIIYSTNDPSVVIDWSTWQLVIPPTPASPSINHAVQLDGTHVIQYEVPAVTGTDVFQWTVCDTLGNCASTSTYAIILDCATPPTTVADSACVECGNSVIIDVLANDLAGNNPIDQTSVQISTAPTNGTANPLVDGTILYTPTISTGSDSFEYTVANVSGDVSDPALVTIEIFCAGDDAIAALCNTP